MNTQAAVAVSHTSSRWHFLSSASFWISFVLLVSIIGFLSYTFEDIKDQFPWLTSAQLWAYGKMSHAEIRPPRPKWVVGVEVDDKTFFEEMHRNGPEDITDRAYLAKVVSNAAEADPAVIALDINLVREETNGESTPEDNKALWDAIQSAQQKNIPVVLTFAFDVKSMRPLNDIFPTNDLPICAKTLETNAPQTYQKPLDVYAPRAGFDHAPADMRKVPLVVTAHNQSGDLECRSFALQVVDAYETVTGIEPKATSRLEESIKDREFAYTTFLPQKDFRQSVSASDVYARKNLDRLRHRIVLIGGKRHRWPANERSSDDAMLDYHRSPEGPMAGMYFHANYIEGMLDDRILAPVSRFWATAFDVLLAAIIIFSIEIFKGWPRVGVVLVLLAVPVGMSYVMILYGRCFDWILPVVLSCAHPAIEHYIGIAKDPLGRKRDEEA